jgi:hypothetical protein
MSNPTFGWVFALLQEEIYQQREYGKASFLRKPDHQAVLFAALSFCIQKVSP